MLNLIIKDILIQKKNFIFGLLYLGFFVFVFQSLGEAMFTGAIVAFVYLLTSGTFAYDDKNKADIMLNSLPIKRRDIVRAKYISLIVYMILGTIAFSAISFIFVILKLPLSIYPITIQAFLGALFAISLMNSIFFPLMFKLGYTRAKVANMLLFFAFFFGLPLVINNIISKENNILKSGIFDAINKQSDAVIGFAVLVISIIILLLSYMLSIKLYKQREF
ncbi:MAG: hypothetical protein BWY74_01741 [Firmicutes bacterium ADurb.Bin419]|nr:MAG: hypothetical protein BWY74_01741 [Firmicutes bacterium ADurb.Bin419]